VREKIAPELRHREHRGVASTYQCSSTPLRTRASASSAEYICRVMICSNKPAPCDKKQLASEPATQLEPVRPSPSRLGRNSQSDITRGVRTYVLHPLRPLVQLALERVHVILGLQQNQRRISLDG
jgi:hypothetical protein